MGKIILHLVIVLMICCLVLGFPATAVDVSLASNLTELQTTTAQIAQTNITVVSSTIVVANTTGNFSPISAVTDTSLKPQFYYNSKLVDERVIGPGLPPKGWAKNANIPNMMELSTFAINATNVPLFCGRMDVQLHLPLCILDTMIETGTGYVYRSDQRGNLSTYQCSMGFFP